MTDTRDLHQQPECTCDRPGAIPDAPHREWCGMDPDEWQRQTGEQLMEPTSIYDIYCPDWNALTDERRAEVMAWMRAEGMDPDNTTRVEVYQTEEPYAIVTEYTRDEQGHHMINPETDTPAKTERTVMLSSLPPEETR